MTALGNVRVTNLAASVIHKPLKTAGFTKHGCNFVKHLKDKGQIVCVGIQAWRGHPSNERFFLNYSVTSLLISRFLYPGFLDTSCTHLTGTWHLRGEINDRSYWSYSRDVINDPSLLATAAKNELSKLYECPNDVEVLDEILYGNPWVGSLRFVLSRLEAIKTAIALATIIGDNRKLLDARKMLDAHINAGKASSDTTHALEGELAVFLRSELAEESA